MSSLRVRTSRSVTASSRRSPATPENADDPIRGLAATGAELFDPHRKRRPIDSAREKVLGQSRPFRAAPLLDQGEVARARDILMGPPGVFPHLIGGGGLIVDQGDLV